MITVFIDTSVILSASFSKLGASALILGYCRKNKIKGFISKYVLSEIKRNIPRLDQLGKQRLNFYILQSNLDIVNNPSLDEMATFQEFINPKDAPVLAAAVKNKVSYLVTHNTKDFMLPKIKTFVKPLIVLTPRDFLKLVK